MVHFINTIRMVKMSIDWATILSDYLHEQLIAMKADPRFYMTSYMVYLLEVRTTYYLGHYKKGSMEDDNSWPYLVLYPQLVKKKLYEQSVEYRIVNKGFTFTIIQFIEGDYAKMMSI